MSAPTSVKRDSHGLYVRCSGILARPERSKMSERMTDPPPTMFVEGEAVRVGHIPQADTIRVRPVEGEQQEVWFGHGSYFDLVTLRHIDSERLWNPIKEA